MSVNSDGTVVFFTPKGRILVDAPMGRGLVNGRRKRAGMDAGLPPVPSVHPDAPSRGERLTLSNGAALHRDSAIPWEIEAAAREAMEESLE